MKYVTYLNAHTFSPSLSLDKRSLIVASEIDGVRNIWMLDINEGVYSDSLYQVTNFITNVFNPVYAESTTLIFTGFEKFSFNLYSYPLEVNEDADYIIMEPVSAPEQWRPSLLTAYAERGN
jgi:Tol biopolymer transport system component